MRRRKICPQRQDCLKVGCRSSINLHNHWSEKELTLEPAKRPIGTQKCKEADDPRAILNNDKMVQRMAC